MVFKMLLILNIFLCPIEEQSRRCLLYHCGIHAVFYLIRDFPGIQKTILSFVGAASGAQIPIFDSFLCKHI